MKAKKLISIALAALMLISSLTVSAFAIESAVDPDDDFYVYYTNTYATQQAKVDTMTKMYENDVFEMYFDTDSGEFALKNKKTGEYTFSNPYDMNETEVSTNLAKNALLSQVLIEYEDTLSGTPAYLSSFGSAATEEQLTFKTLTNGVRVEYALGTVESKRLIPIWITDASFENKILAVLQDSVSLMSDAEKTTYNKMTSGTYYKKYDQTDPSNSLMIELWRQEYPCLDKNHDMIIYVFQGTERVKSQVEKLIRKYCTSYTYDELEADHDETGYEANEKELPLFRLAVEYTLDDVGLTATIPAKSIRYNSTNYNLLTIVLLPYFGCTSVVDTGNISRTGGYIFIPDGSGTLLEYYDASGAINTGTQGTGVMYGQDFAKVQLQSGSANAERAKVPVFGLTEEYDVTYTTARINRPSKIEIKSYSRGYVGIILEGETFASITANLGQMAWANLATISMDYNTVYASFSTTDEDTVETGGTLGSASTMSTTIDTKYTGNYSVKYITLSDPATAEASGTDYYAPTYVGMADAYRDYLIETGVLASVLGADTADELPLYVESFGAIKASSTFLTFPITVTKPLTTFDNVISMMSYFGENGIKNQKYVLTGFGNGTMTKTYYPTSVDWDGTLGGKSGLKKLISYANENGYLIYPNYDFMNVEAYKMSYSLSKYTAKTMSGRYATIREYEYVMQEFERIGSANIVSANALDEIYKKFSRSYNKYNIGAVAAKTVGYEINSDFDNDDPLMREDSKYYISEFLRSMREDNGYLLVSGGNAYTLPYATDIIELPLDNSGYAISSYSVPFLGIVLHGYKNYSGKAINMEGDTKYAVLKAIENGAGLYFILSYQNTNLVKTSTISEYYSMNFDTLKGDVVKYYNMVNDAIGDMQNATITDHSFPTAYRMDTSIAAVMFGLAQKARDDYKTAEQNYFDIVSEVDTLIRNSQNADAKIIEETAATSAYNAARNYLKNVQNLIDRYNTGDVVKVTYTSDSGVSKTFYINYNTYSVAVEGKNGKVFVVEPESFIAEDDITYVEDIVTTRESVAAYTATTKQKANFESAYKELKKALDENNTLMIERRKETVAKAVSQMTAVDNVYSAVLSTGETVIINYTSNQVTVKLSDTDYRTIASQSYIVISD